MPVPAGGQRHFWQCATNNIIIAPSGIETIDGSSSSYWNRLWFHQIGPTEFWRVGTPHPREEKRADEMPALSGSAIFHGVGSLGLFRFPQVLSYLNAFPGIPFPQHLLGQTKTVQNYLFPGAAQPLLPLPKRPQVLSFANAFSNLPFPQHLSGKTSTVQSFLYPGAAQPTAVFDLLGIAIFTGSGGLAVLPSGRYLTNPVKFSGAGGLSVLPSGRYFTNPAIFAGAGGLAAIAHCLRIGIFAGFGGLSVLLSGRYLTNQWRARILVVYLLLVQ